MSSEPTKGKGPSWGGRTLLIVSLAANLFMAGVIVGNNHQAPGKDGFRGGPFPLMSLNSPMDFRRIVKDPEVGAKLKSTLDETRPQMFQAMRNMANARSNMVEALKAETVDPDALADAFENTRIAEDAVRELAQQSIKSFILSLTPEQRIEIVTEIEKLPFRPIRPGMGFSDGERAFPMRPGERFGPAGAAPDTPETAPEE